MTPGFCDRGRKGGGWWEDEGWEDEGWEGGEQEGEPAG